MIAKSCIENPFTSTFGLYIYHITGMKVELIVKIVLVVKHAIK